MTTWESNGHVTADVTWPETSRSWPQYVWCPLSRKWLEIATWSQNWQIGASIGNGYLGIEWSRHWWRHATLKGQGRDSDMFGAIISKMAGDSNLVTMERL